MSNWRRGLERVNNITGVRGLVTERNRTSNVTVPSDKGGKGGADERKLRRKDRKPG